MSEPAHGWRRYVAIGDSVTEGLVDPTPDGGLRGWADRFAQHLADQAGEPVEYANLAIRGRQLKPIIAEQLEPALALKPDLVSLWGGGNDLLRARADVDAITNEMERAVIRLREAGVDVIVGTGIDSKGSPVLELTRPRTAIYNANVWAIARRHGAYVIDVWGMRCLKDWQLWYDDRLHFNSIGHERVSHAALVAVGLQPRPGWDDPLPDAAAEVASGVAGLEPHLGQGARRPVDRTADPPHLLRPRPRAQAAQLRVAAPTIARPGRIAACLPQPFGAVPLRRPCGRPIGCDSPPQWLRATSPRSDHALPAAARGRPSAARY